LLYLFPGSEFEMRRLTLSLIAGAAAIAAGGIAYAQAPQPQALTRATVEQRSARAFDRLDANRDGKLDRADRADRQKARFDRVDANHDGSVSYAEFAAMHTQKDGVRGERFGRRGDTRGDHRMAMRGLGRRGPGGMMARMGDADSDGAITRAEFQGAALARFDRLDANKDGTVTRDEAKAARDNMRQRWQSRRETRAS
jgi:Ca2+-binding EF-hand superfamily protein